MRLDSLYIVATEGEFYRTVEMVTTDKEEALFALTREDQSVYHVDLCEILAHLLHFGPWRRRDTARHVFTMIKTTAR